MLSLTCSPVKFTSSHILHLVHPRDTKNPIVLREIAGITCKQNSYIAKAGETIMTQPRFESFTTIVIHSCTPSLRKDFLQKLLHDWKDRLLEYTASVNKHVLVFGNMIPTVSNTVFFVPKTDTVFVNDYAKSGDVDIETTGLGLSRIRFDIDFDSAHVGERYASCIGYYSRKFPIYLLDSNVLVCNNGDISLGTLYLAKQGKLSVVKRAVNFAKQHRSAKVPPIHAIYKEEDENTLQPRPAVEAKKKDTSDTTMAKAAVMLNQDSE